MKALKLFLLAVIGSLSIGAAAQEYEVKGVVIDAKGNPVVGAIIRTNKSKNSTITKDGGVYTLTATPKDTELRLIMNKYTVMEKELSATIAAMPIAFELDETNDPAVTGYMAGDTYYPGTNDANIEDLVKKRFIGFYYMDGGISKFDVGKFDEKYVPIKCYDIDGSIGNMLTVTDPQQIYSIKLIKETTSYGSDGVNGVVVIVTKAHHEANKSVEKANISVGKDSIRGVVKDGWGRVVPDMKIKTPSGEVAVSDDSGRYAIRVTNKDKYLRCTMDYTEGTTVRITKANISKPVNLIVMLRQNDLRGYMSNDLTTYYLGATDLNWKEIFASRFPGVKYSGGDIYIRNQFKESTADNYSSAIESIENSGLTPLEKGSALIILDGSKLIDATLESVEPQSVYCVQIIKENAVPLYGTYAQYGALVITTKGQQQGVVAMTDFESVAAKRQGDMKGFIAAQGKNLEYDDAGYILVNGKRCGLYIINDKEFTHMRGIEVDMIDDIIILNDDYTASYGEKAKNGVVLISASQKEKKVVDEEGNTVTEKEYKQQQKSKKK